MTAVFIVSLETKNSLDRRQFLRQLGLISGGALAATTAAADTMFSVAAAYVRNVSTDDAPPSLLSEQQMQVLRAVCTHVIPTTETPGAVDVDAHGFVDNQLYRCHSPDEQDDVLESINALDESAQASSGCEFVACGTAQQRSLLVAAEEKGIAGNFALLKSLIVFGYFTSEAGALGELAYDPVPGEFDGSMPYGDVGRSWLSG